MRPSSHHNPPRHLAVADGHTGHSRCAVLLVFNLFELGSADVVSCGGTTAVHMLCVQPPSTMASGGAPDEFLEEAKVLPMRPPTGMRHRVLDSTCTHGSAVMCMSEPTPRVHICRSVASKRRSRRTGVVASMSLTFSRRRCTPRPTNRSRITARSAT